MYTAHIVTAKGEALMRQITASSWQQAYDLVWRRFPGAIEIDVY